MKMEKFRWVYTATGWCHVVNHDGENGHQYSPLRNTPVNTDKLLKFVLEYAKSLLTIDCPVEQKHVHLDS